MNPHFLDEEMGLEGLGNLPFIVQVVIGRAGVQTLVLKPLVPRQPE